MMGERKTEPFTACATSNMAKALSETFDENRDNTVTAEEKSVLMTTLAVSPSSAALKFCSHVGLSSLAQTIGSCGRLIISEGGLVPLADLLDSDLDTRLDLASQLLDLVQGLVAGVEGWLMILWDLNIKDFSVTQTGQVVLSRLSHLTPVDRTILMGLPEGKREVCNEDCFRQWKEEVMMPTPRGQPGRGCSSTLLYSDLMFSSLCSSVLKGEEGNRGLLHSAPQNLLDLVQECSVEQWKGGRWQAVEDLLDYLANDLENATVTSELQEEKENYHNSREFKRNDEEEEDLEDLEDSTTNLDSEDSKEDENELTEKRRNLDNENGIDGENYSDEEEEE